MSTHKTALHAEHLARNARMTDFHGWEMPLYYTSILEEHTAVRGAVGIFDISHMGQIWLEGPGALETLNRVVVSDMEKVAQGRACYTLLLNERGGILDDVIVYRVGPEEYLVIVNCGNRSKDYEWLVTHQRATVDIRQISTGRSILAVQGPRAAEALGSVLDVSLSALGRFSLRQIPFGDLAWVARTGYTGSDGFEMFLSDRAACQVWRGLLERTEVFGVQPVGLGARDTLRVEAGYRLYGTDMDEHTTPYEAGLEWTVAMHKRGFIGQVALRRQQAEGTARRLIGFEVGQGPVPRQGCKLFSGTQEVGTVTSGTFSLSRKAPIGLGYVATALAQPGQALCVSIRDKMYPATIVKPPFWQKGQADRAGVGEPVKSGCS